MAITELPAPLRATTTEPTTTRHLAPEHVPTDRDRGLLSSVQRALRVLDVVSSAEDGVTAKAVARRAGLKLSTTYHLLNTLVSEGYLVRLEDAHGYGIGYKIPKLYQRLRLKLDVVPGVGAAVARVHEIADAAAYYASFRDTQIVIAHVVDSVRTPRVEPLHVGFHEAAHATAFGKVMLATLTPGQRRSYLNDHGMPQLTPLTVTDRWELEAELDLARINGVVTEVEEFQLKVACVGAPVRDASGTVVGAMGLSVPAREYADRRVHLERTLLCGAEQAGHAIALAGEDATTVHL